jgi:hypothetical protein
MDRLYNKSEIEEGLTRFIINHWAASPCNTMEFREKVLEYIDQVKEERRKKAEG